MAEVRYYTSLGSNYKNGSLNGGGSQMVGWDARVVRSEVYAFHTGDWPITHIRWWGPTTSVYQGSNISIRYIISTSETAYVNAYGAVAGSYELIKNDYNNLDVYLAPNTTYYFTFFPGISRDSGWGLLNIGDQGPGNYFSVWSTEQTYTACSAPTNIWLSASIQVPGQNVTLNWSGASGGINTTISSYNIYRSTSASGSYSYLGNSTGTSYTVAAPSAGSYYYYKIVTQCAQGTDYNSGFSAASGGLKGNTVPGAPSVSVNRSTVPSTGGAVTFTVTAGSDPDGQTLSLYYSATSGGTKTKFTSPLSINITNNSTYYFYTFDGLQYSSVTSKAVSVNTKPVISSATYNAITTYSALGGSGATGSQIGYASSITPKFSANKTGWITVELEYYASNGTSAWDSSSVTRKTLQNTTKFTSTSNVVLSAHNIHQYISLGSTNLHWRLRLRMEDGVEYSDYVYYPSGGQYYSIARPSSLIASYNQFSNSNISGTIAGQIWRRVRLRVYNDTSVPLANVTAKVNGSTISNSVSTSVDGVYRYIDITVADGIASGATVNLTAQMKDSANSITKNISATVTETKIPLLTTLSHGAATIKPFTSTGTFTVSTVWPFGSYETLNSATFAAYNCNTTPSNVIKFVYSSSNSGSGANRVVTTPSWSKSSDNMAASLDRSTVYGWNHALGISNYTGTATYYCRVEITNLFGKVVTTPWLSRTFDFREPVGSPTISSIEWSTDATNWTTLGANDKIQQGIYLRFNCSFGLYTTDEVTASMLLTNSSGEKSIGCYEFGSPNKITPITYLATELTRATNRTIKTNTKSYVYHITTEIGDTVNRKWRLRFVNSGGTTYSSYTTTGVTRQCAPNLRLIECTTDQNYNISYSFTMTDDGGADTLTNYLYDGSSNITGELSGTSGTISATVTGWEVKTISVKSVSVVTGLITNTKNYYSNVIIVYQLSPTVAYRKNQIGINTNNPDSNAIVDIHPTTGKEVILIQGLDANLTPTKYEINTVTGQIKFYFNGVQQSTIDLFKGILT